MNQISLTGGPKAITLLFAASVAITVAEVKKELRKYGVTRQDLRDDPQSRWSPLSFLFYPLNQDDTVIVDSVIDLILPTRGK